MFKNLSIIGLVFAGFVLQGCDSAISQSSNTQIESASPQPRKDEVPKQQKVEFKGVSFSYNPQIFGEVKTEEVAELPLENETDKPDSVAPQHLLFKLKNLKINRETVVYIFPIEDYRRMFAVSSRDTKTFDEQLNGLQKVIIDKTFRIDNDIPSFQDFW